MEYTRKHTARVNEGLGEIRAMIEPIVAKRDDRNDGFVASSPRRWRRSSATTQRKPSRNSARTELHGSVAKEAITLAQEKGRFTVVL